MVRISKSKQVLNLIIGLALIHSLLRADDPPASESPLVKLLKSGRVPEARQGTILEMIGKRGTVGDLDYVYQQALAGRFSPSNRIKAFDALAEAALTRDLKPAQDRAKLIELLGPGSPRASSGLAEAAVRLAGLWKLETAGDALGALARSPATGAALRAAAIDALATIGGRAGRAQIESLTAPGTPATVRLVAVAALVRLDPDAAATRAAELIPQATAQGLELQPLIAAFLNRQGAGAVLAGAIGRQAIPADAAKLALRAVYSLSLSDPALVAALGRAAGMATEVPPMTPAELNALVAEVAAKGDPARGEAVFRRSDLNCLSCHALSKAGGDVGPDLSAVGQSSPTDYIIHAIVIPDQSIKEQYHTLVVLTSDGQVFQGIVTDKDSQRVVLKESTGALRIVPVSAIEDQKPGGSLMPRGLVNLMTRSEFVDLVRFLSELGKPGPYAIRTTPVIQRWRVLQAVPPALAANLPDPATFRDQVLHAAPERWSSAYAKVSGALPLAELGASSGGRVLYLQGELDVSVGGSIRIRPDSPEGIRFWVDDQLAPAGTRAFIPTLSSGRHPVTFRIEASARPARAITVEVDKPSNSPAEFTVVGGK
jgi:putative heme-binding domain-containing protein